MSHMIVAQVVMIQLYHSYFTQPQAQQQVLEASEVEPVLLAVAAEQLLDVVLLLQLCGFFLILGYQVIWWVYVGLP